MSCGGHKRSPRTPFKVQIFLFGPLRSVRIFRVFIKYSLESSSKKVQVGKDQEKAQSEKDSHSKNRGGKKQTNNQVLIP